MKITWALFEKIGLDIVQALVFVIFAKILGPEAFGIVGILSVFITFSKSIIESGLKDVIVKHQKISNNTLSAFLLFQFALSCLIYFIFFVIAPWISDYFQDIRLINLTRILSLNLFFISLSIIHSSLIYKQENYKLLTRIRVFSTMTATIFGLSHAVVYGNYWSLVLYQLLLSVTTLVLNLRFSPLKLSTPSFDIRFLNGLKMGYKLLLASLLNSNFHSIMKFVIGSKLSMSSVGYYSQTIRLSHLLTKTTSNFVGRFMYPILSKRKDKKLMLFLLKTAPIYFFLVQLFLVFFGEIFIDLILGEEWIFILEGLIIIISSGYMFFTSVLAVNYLIVFSSGKEVLLMRFFSFLLPILGILIVEINYLNVILITSLNFVISFIISIWFLRTVLSLRLIMEICLNNILLLAVSFAMIIDIWHIMKTSLVVLMAVSAIRILYLIKSYVSEN